MEIYNEAGKSIYLDAEQKKCDEQIKKTLSIKIFLAHILKECLDEFKDYDPYEIAEVFIEGKPKVSAEAVHRDESEVIQGMDREDNSKDEGLAKFDILFHAYVPSSGEMVKLIINIEAQQTFTPGYPLLRRAVYYCSRLISAQHNKEFKNSEYGNVKKVISIWLCTDAPKNKQNTVTRFSMTEKNLVGEAKFNFKDYDLLEIVMVCLGGSKSDKNYSGVIKLVDTLTSQKLRPSEINQILTEDYKIKLTEEIEREVLGMCNISHGIYERGITEGREENLVYNLKMLMKNLGISFDEALKALSVPEDEYSKYRKMVLG